MKNYSILALLASLLCMETAGQTRIEPPVMGWSSWNTYRVNISDSLICSQADALHQKGLDALGYRYINIDDGFFGGRNAEGQLVAHPQRFPRGLRPVVDHIHALGLKAGIYSDAGRNTCGSFWDKDSLGMGVGFYGHDEQDARFYFDSCRFDFIKIDFCGGDAAQNAEKLDLDERQRYLDIRAAINETSRPEAKVNVCRWAFPGTWVAQAGTSWRIAGDIAPTWNSLKQIVGKNKYLSAYAANGCYNDMDMLEIGRGLTEAEERTHFGLWCLLSSPLLIGCDLHTIPETSLALLKNKALIALNQDPLGKQAYVVRQDSGTVVFVKDIVKENGLERAVAVTNFTDAPRDFTLDFAEVQLGGVVQVYDLFQGGEPKVAIDGKLTLEIAPHDTQIYRLKATRRFERHCYEAETAWLDAYQCLQNPLAVGTAFYEDAPACSGGGKVCHVGGKTGNWMEWRRVFSPKGGNYRMTLDYSSEEMCAIRCSVNGGEPFAKYVTSGGKDRMGQCVFQLRLVPGMNTIRISGEKDRYFDVDAMHLEPL